jgi:hypothetical protein
MDGHPGLLPLIGAGAGQNPAYGRLTVNLWRLRRDQARGVSG